MPPVTGKYSQKMYRCTRCGHEALHGTNHWGEIYPSCPKCSWKNPMQPQAVHECLEPIPEGMGVPEKWTFVRLGDIAEIKQGMPLPRDPLAPARPTPPVGIKRRRNDMAITLAIRDRINREAPRLESLIRQVKQEEARHPSECVAERLQNLYTQIGRIAADLMLRAT